MIEGNSQFGVVYFRMCEPEIIEQFRIRPFDSANSWSSLD